jgi:hypothetical protein
VLPDGTQIWRLFHNGVDTHTIHTHLFHAQLVNRLGQDGILLPNDPIELGWKDTFRVNPLEITYIAMRPTVPTQSDLPFEAPDSVRLIDPTLPEGATLTPPAPGGWLDPQGIAIREILNHYVNIGWEYVWHCHILAHEEMDMMHSLVFAVPPRAPTGLTGTPQVSGNSGRVTLRWTDNSQREAGFLLQRAGNAGFTSGVRSWSFGPNQVTYTDNTPGRNGAYWYRVWAIGPVVGDTQTVGFPTMSADSVSNTIFVQVGTATAPLAPTNLTAAWQAGPQVALTWTDNANNETGFVVERSTGVDCGLVPTNNAQIATPGPSAGTGAGVTYVDKAVSAYGSYSYRVKAVTATGSSAYTNTVANVASPGIPAAPTNVGVTTAKDPAPATTYTASLNWVSAANPTNFTVQRATNAAFTRGVTSSTVAGTLRTATQTGLNANTRYYYRVRASGIAGSSAWTNASPFPVVTGN